MSRIFDAIQKSHGQLGEIGRKLVNDGTPHTQAPQDENELTTLPEAEAPVVRAEPVAAAEIVPPAVVRQEAPVIDTEPEPEPPPPPRRRRPVLTILLFGAIAAGGYSAWRVSQGQPAFPWTAAGAAASEMRFTGVVIAQETAVAAKIPGRLERLLVDEGSTVKAGEVIAVLDRQETAADRNNQQAKVDQLNARLLQSEELVHLETEKNEHQLQRASAQVKAAEGDLRTAQVELEQSRKDRARRQDLFKDGIIASSEMERYQMNVEVNEARVKALQERVQATQSDLDLIRSNLRQVKVVSSDVDQTRAQIVQAQAMRQQADVRLEYSTIRAPMSGLVSVRVARQGEVVAAGNPIVTLVDLNDIWVRADVEETWINRIRLGSTLTVQLASGERTTGDVFFISPEADFATMRDINRVKRDVRTFAIKVRLKNESRRIHPGMTAYVMLPGTATAEVQ